jgi:glycosyltransferase involved in cell wall biosynthesis
LPEHARGFTILDRCIRTQAAGDLFCSLQMTRALVIEPAGNLWGSERALLDLLDGLRGVEIAVVCPPNRPLVAELVKRGIRTLPRFIYGLHNKSRWHRLRAAIEVFRACVEYRPDVIYLNQCGAYRVALPTALLLNVPIVAHVRIFEDVCYIARKRPNPSRLRGLIAISTAVEKALRRFPELELIPVHRIYDTYMLGPTRYSENRLTNRVACVGRLTPIKGQDVLIRAMRLVTDELKDVKCLFVGDGEQNYVQSLKRMAADQGLEASIRWQGFVNDVLSLLQTSSVLVCPSHREPLGRVIFEAWDAGAVPVVFAGSGGAAELVSEAGGGILYEEQTPHSLATALKRALRLEGAESARLVTNGRSWMAKHCDPRRYGEAISDILTIRRKRVI